MHEASPDAAEITPRRPPESSAAVSGSFILSMPSKTISHLPIVFYHEISIIELTIYFAYVKIGTIKKETGRCHEIQKRGIFKKAV